jgi:hypothetical protein
MIQRKPLILLATISLLSCFSIASAQKISVAITPASIDAKVSRGASYTQIFTLVNDTGTRLRFKCSVADMWYDESNNRLTGRPGTLQRSASLWVQFSPEEIIVEPHTSGTVTALVTVPNTAAGSYYSVPVFEGMPADPVLADATLAKVSTATATFGIRFNGLMMFTTLDASEFNVEIMGGQITPPSASTELAMQLDVRNRSNAHVNVRGAFAILNSSGALAGRGSISERGYLPGQRKMLETQWAGELLPGTYTAVITLSYDRMGMDAATLVYELPLVVQ